VKCVCVWIVFICYLCVSVFVVRVCLCMYVVWLPLSGL